MIHHTKPKRSDLKKWNKWARKVRIDKYPVTFTIPTRKTIVIKHTP